MRALAARHARPIGCGLAFCAVLGGVFIAQHWLTTSPRFDIERVACSERHWLSDAAFEARLAIAAQPNLFLYDTAAAAARLEESPWVRSAAIRRSFPDGLEVDIVENVPAAVAVLGDLYLVDIDGHPFKRTTASESAGLDLLVITGISRERATADLDAVETDLASAIEIARRWSAGQGRVPVSEINLDPVRGATVVGEHGSPAIRLGVGDADEIEQRMALFDRSWASLDDAEQQRATRIHLDQAATPTRVAMAFRHTP